MDKVVVWLKHWGPQRLLGSLSTGFLIHQVGGRPPQIHLDVALISSHSVSYLDPGCSRANYICSGEILGMKILQRCQRPRDAINCSHQTRPAWLTNITVKGSLWGAPCWVVRTHVPAAQSLASLGWVSGQWSGQGSWAQLAPDPQLLHNKVTRSLVYGSTLFPSTWCYLIISYKPKKSRFY